VVRAGIVPARLVAATGAAAVTDAVALTRHALDCGVVRCLVVPPFFFKGVSDDAVYGFFAGLIEAVRDARLRLYLYHIPQFSGVPVSPDVVARLAQAFPDVVAGVKDSAGEWENTAALLARVPHLDILAGHEPHLPRLMRAGGAGTICGVANVYPHLVARLLAPDVTAGDAARVDAFLAVLLSLPFLPALKALRGLQTGDPAWRIVRPPWLAFDDDACVALRDAMRDAGFTLP
jgi:4-hydroxy-tetrahydrodipicolinate synthase